MRGSTMFYLALYSITSSNWDIPEENPNMRWLRTWNFQGYWRNAMWKFQVLIKKELGFIEVIKKIHLKFPMPFSHVSYFLKGITQFSRIFRGFLRKYVLKSPCLHFFWKNLLVQEHDHWVIRFPSVI